jgi:hypothetical protein
VERAKRRFAVIGSIVEGLKPGERLSPNSANQKVVEEMVMATLAGTAALTALVHVRWSDRVEVESTGGATAREAEEHN